MTGQSKWIDSSFPVSTFVRPDLTPQRSYTCVHDHLLLGTKRSSSGLTYESYSNGQDVRVRRLRVTSSEMTRSNYTSLDSYFSD